MTHTTTTTSTVTPAEEAAIRAQLGSGIVLREVWDSGHQWDAMGGWASLEGRLLIQWRDTQDQGPYWVVDGDGAARPPEREIAITPAEAIRAAIEDREPDTIESSTWHDRVLAFRVRTRAEVGALDPSLEDEPGGIYEMYCRGSQDDRAWILEELAERTVLYHPTEPDCDHEDPDDHDHPHLHHRWIPDSEPRYNGSGTGVARVEECALCGVQRHTDTSATDPCDGTQGHYQVAYYRADGVTVIPCPGVPEMPEVD